MNTGYLPSGPFTDLKNTQVKTKLEDFVNYLNEIQVCSTAANLLLIFSMEPSV